MARIGVISDTHGLLRPQALAFLRGCDRIIHGGDIGHEGILRELAQLAPVTAVRGNNDRGPWAQRLPETAWLELGQVRIHVLHDLSQLGIEPLAAGARVIVSGHSHRPSLERRGGVLYLNPGSPGPRRFKLPVAIAELLVDGGEVRGRIVELDIVPRA